MKRLVVVTVGLLIMAAQSARADRPGAVFLMIFPDARTVALGGCGVALSDLGENSYYNPAAFGFGPRIGATWSHACWLPGLYGGMHYEFAGATYRVQPNLGVGLNFTYISTGETDVINERGEYLGSYRTCDLAPQVSVGYRVFPNLAAGVGAKIIYSYLVPSWVWEHMPELGIEGGGDALSVGFDAGVQFRALNWLGLGLAVQNLGPPIRYTAGGESDPLPSMLRLGWEVGPDLSGPVEVRFVSDLQRDLVTEMKADSFVDFWEELWVGFGLELRFLKTASVRLGYFEDIQGQRGGVVIDNRSGGNHVSLLRYLIQKTEGEARLSGLCWGVGIEFEGFAVDIGIDENIYDFATRNVRLQLSYKLR